MRTYTLSDFMEYPNLSLKIAMILPFTWSGAASQKSVAGSSNYQLLMRVWFIFGAMNLIYQNLGMLIYLFVPQAQRPDTSDMSAISAISETCSIMCLTLVAACKMWILFWHGERISALLEEFQSMFPSAQLQRQQARTVAIGTAAGAEYRVKHYACSSQLLMRRTTIFFIFAFIFYNMMPVIVLLYELLSSEQELSYRYQSNTWYPWQNAHNRSSLLAYVAAYLCQLQSSLTGVAFIMAGEFMLCFFITQMQMHFNYLANALECLDAGQGELSNRKLKALIDYHNRLLRFSKEINNIFNISFLVNFATSSIAICLMGFSMVMISMVHACKYSVGLLSFLIFTLFICYNGSEFTSASDQLMPAAFYANWYDGNMSFRKMILFFMMRSEQPGVLRAYKFSEVSMVTFMKILKFSYQLFTFFRAMGT